MLNPMDYQGMVEEPGKFEGEANATRYYWELVLNGEGEDYQPVEDGTVFSLFTVDAEEEAAFGGDAGLDLGDTVAVFEDSHGFVSMLAFGTREAAMSYLDQYFG